MRFGAEEEDSVLEVLRSGRLAQGPKVEELERLFAEAHGATFAVAVNNGTTALVAAMRALDLEPGDEVITSPFSFVATLNSILEAGATARFADVGDDFCLDPASVEALIGPRTKAILPVHLFGLPADMDALSQIAQRHDLAIVEDAAQAHGAMVADRPVGTYGLACFSLYATKNITSGEGGVITTNDASKAERLRLLRNQGMRARYEYVIAGHNYRMTELQAAIAIPQMHRLEAITSRRRANAAKLSEGLAGISGLHLPVEPTGRTHVFHQYTVRVGADAICDRGHLAKRLEDAGVGSGIYYPRLMHDYDCYRNHPLVGKDSTPRAASVAAEVLSLPVHQHLTDADVDEVVAAVREALR
ncbi:MAG TPA: DegT/DnrJ/EryC1/StrS family aminotransferase [Acidimicrobiales bacterium]